MKYKNIHFVGIKGVGMAPLAVIAKEAGCTVSGSDVDEVFITDVTLEAAGITPAVGFSPEHIQGADLIITTGAHGGLDNVEVKTAKEKGIPVLMQGQAVGEFMKEEIFGKPYQGISVAGTHGKTTTTAMIATILSDNELDPGFLIGTSEVPSLGKAGHFGTGEYFVAEADEYATDPKYDKTPKFLWQHPNILVVTNVEFDHPDVYSDLTQMESAYKKLFQNIRENGCIIACGDSENLLSMLNVSNKEFSTYGENERNDVQIVRSGYTNGLLTIELKEQDGNTVEISLHTPGKHNALNATAAYMVCRKLGLSVEQIQKGLLAFKGTKRRMEYKGALSTGAEVYDDYAHHPTEIASSLNAFREMYPDKKIICIFQPHTYSRTKELLEQFKHSFTDADSVIITEIYASQREEKDPHFSARILADGIEKETFFLENASDVVKYVTSEQYNGDFVLITMGAGDIYKIDSELLNK